MVLEAAGISEVQCGLGGWFQHWLLVRPQIPGPVRAKTACLSTWGEATKSVCRGHEIPNQKPFRAG